MAIATTQLPTGTYTVDPIHSSVAFEVTHMVVSKFRGGFGSYDAKLDTSDGQPRLSGTVDVASIEVKSPDLAGHLQSPDFFDAERAPQLRFESADIRIADDNSVALQGELEIKGVTKPVTASGHAYVIEQDITGGQRIGLVLDTTVDRREYGLNWNAPLPKGGWALGNDVKLQVALEFVPAS